jgi:DNA-binding transcriptional ArsR family regulator
MAQTTDRRNPSPARPGGLVRPGIASPGLPAVELDARTGYDFLISPCSDCGELQDLLPEDRAWVEKSRADLAVQLGSGPWTDACMGFVTEVGRLLVGRPEVRTAGQVVAAVDDLSDRDLVETLLGELLDDQDLGGTARLAVDGDAQAYADLQLKLEQLKGTPVLTATPQELAAGTRRIVHAWLPHYEGIEERIGQMLERDVSARPVKTAAADPFGFVEQATNGIRLAADTRVRRIVLAPSYFGRPYNSLTRIGQTQLICYPIADGALDGGDTRTPPPSAVRLYRALGDETRLRILRLLAERDRYLTELATDLELSKPTISHHLAQLRSAGLITVTGQGGLGNYTYYTLRRDRIEEAGIELTSYLAV